MKESIVVLDFGSQYTQLIARRVRELGVYSEIKPFNTHIDELVSESYKGFILSGGPASVWDTNSPTISPEILELDVPVLGICYGMQLMMNLLGGKVEKSSKREYGPAVIKVNEDNKLFENLPSTLQVWMSHSDKVLEIPDGFVAIAESKNAPVSAVRSGDSKLFGTQFHPEVVHTSKGKEILSNFLFKICNLSPSWSPESFVDSSVIDLKNRLEECKVICALSGGVDSAVAAMLLKEAIGDNLYCIFVDNGLLRLNESSEVAKAFQTMGLNFQQVNASRNFLDKLSGVVDPEEKRKIIGNEFINVFESEASKISDVEYLAQGTLYPDVIESVSVKGPSVTIKSHHNVGGLPEKMNLKLIEPLRELFKDEVRAVGRTLKIPDSVLNRHPFPGPGLAIRILGTIDQERLEILRLADSIFIEELKASKLYDEIWQAFCVFIPIKTVGVMGDERTYESVIGLRAVTSHDGMTANWAKIPYDVLERVSVRIINEVSGVNRVVYDISTKPPSTIEWE